MNKMKKIIIKNGRVIDPLNHLDAVCDILIDGSTITRIEKNIKAEAEEIIDATDKIVMPGIVDMHVHLREPGREDKETINSGTQAALKGGVTSILAMPNTQPAPDCPENIKVIKEIIQRSANINVFITGTITKARQGEELSDIVKLKQEGVVAISDDGASVDSETLMLEAFKKAQENKLMVICHCEDKTLSAKGVVNLGLTSTRTGLIGISKESEYKRILRDIQLAQKADAGVHIAHVSCRESVEIIAKAKKQGIKVTAETAPHYFALDEEAALGYDTNMKMNPPLRSKDDVASIKEGLKDGTLDVIASDHAPHTENEKAIEFERAEFGTVGLETELAVSITELIYTGILNWPQLVEKLTVNPARILGINKGSLGVGMDADIIIVAPNKEWIVEKKGFYSKSKNSPFLGRTLKGYVEYTICNGNIVYKQ
jgi:dihydroorotase